MYQNSCTRDPSSQRVSSTPLPCIIYSSFGFYSLPFPSIPFVFPLSQAREPEVLLVYGVNILLLHISSERLIISSVSFTHPTHHNHLQANFILFHVYSLVHITHVSPLTHCLQRGDFEIHSEMKIDIFLIFLNNSFILLLILTQVILP